MKSVYFIIPVFLFLVATLPGCKKEDATPTPPTTNPPGGSTTPVVYGSVSDAEGNTYRTVVIGSKTWMADNLKATKYQNGSAITTGLTQAGWLSATSGAYCDYDGDASNASIYGHLYNEYVKTDTRKVCPVGYHVPSDAEWKEMETALGATTAGGKMKETGNSRWLPPNTGADNSSGFSAVPGGSRHNGLFADKGTDAYWWSSNPSSFFYVSYNLSTLRTKTTPPEEALSIRCVKD